MSYIKVNHPQIQIDIDVDRLHQQGFWIPNRLWATTNYVFPERVKRIELQKNAQFPVLSPAVQDFKDWANQTLVTDTDLKNFLTANYPTPTYLDAINAMILDANASINAVYQSLTFHQRMLLIFNMTEVYGDTITQLLNNNQIEWLEDSDEFFDLINAIITNSPQFNYVPLSSTPIAQVGTPFNGLMAVGMGSETGYFLLKDQAFNRQLFSILDAWHTYLGSTDSLTYLDTENAQQPGSWVSSQAYNAGVWKDFVIPNRQDRYLGFSSWTDFFTRTFQAGTRPFPPKSDSVVAIGCETTPWIYDANISPEKNALWIKGNVYSLADIFNGMSDAQGNLWADKFVNGQSYQGFLSATHYHRWHAPIYGQLIQSQVFNGAYYNGSDEFGVTYFSEPEGFGETTDTWLGTASQQYLAQTAARAIYIFHNDSVGYVAMICIGMVEVSSVNIDPGFQISASDQPKDVDAGDEIGMFQFGGSTHMLIFENGKVNLEQWATDINQNNSTVHNLGSTIGHAVS
ncbi:phophatidylserine decarboxylase associated domain-containing protein [Marinomonas sp. THO17]|uniref:phosphatidylserine decarboxylase family protein n=1 Tax=Marinomonas sp. THO17 TaxID=3149048 RepID=UPI00336BF0EF